MADAAGRRPGAGPAETCHDVTTWSRGRVEVLLSSVRDQRIATLILAAAVVVSLSWANVAGATYDTFWTARVDVWIDGHGVGVSTRELVNQGLMSFFFLVVGLEARREWDLGDLRDRRRSLLPLAIGLAGLILPAAIFVIIDLTLHRRQPRCLGDGDVDRHCHGLGGHRR